MKHFFLIFLLFVCITSSFHCSSSSKINHPFIERKDQIFNSQQYENKIYHYITELRRNPKGFYFKYVKSYLRAHPDRFTSFYTSSLKKRLLHQDPLPSLKKSSYLQPITQKHLNYLVKRLKGKRLQHRQGSISFSQRIKGKNLSSFAENLYRAKKNNPLHLIIELLIDQGVRTFGHRNNLLSNKYRLINIQSGKAPNNYIVTVIDFGSKKN